MVDHRRIDDLTLPRALGADDGSQHAEGQQHAATPEVPHQVEGRQRGLAGASQRLEGTGQRDVVDVVSGGLGHRSLLAPTGHAAEHQLRVPGHADVWPESEPLGNPGTKSLHETVRRLHQPENQRHPFGMLQIHGHGPAATVHEVDMRILVGRIRGPFEPVDPHDVGAGIGKHHPGEGSRSQAGQLDDADPIQRAAHRAPAEDRERRNRTGALRHGFSGKVMAGWWPPRTPGVKYAPRSQPARRTPPAPVEGPESWPRSTGRRRL
jgi:hypothetical protein